MAEADHAGIADEDIEADHQDDADEDVDDGLVEWARTHGKCGKCDDQQDRARG